MESLLTFNPCHWDIGPAGGKCLCLSLAWIHRSSPSAWSFFDSGFLIPVAESLLSHRLLCFKAPFLSAVSINSIARLWWRQDLYDAEMHNAFPSFQALLLGVLAAAACELGNGFSIHALCFVLWWGGEGVIDTPPWGFAGKKETSYLDTVTNKTTSHHSSGFLDSIDTPYLTISHPTSGPLPNFGL